MTMETVKVTRTSPVSGLVSTIEVEATAEQIVAWNMGGKVQDCFPHLSADQREFILTGITPVEWEEMFADIPEEDR